MSNSKTFEASDSFPVLVAIDEPVFSTTRAVGVISPMNNAFMDSDPFLLDAKHVSTEDNDKHASFTLLSGPGTSHESHKRLYNTIESDYDVNVSSSKRVNIVCASSESIIIDHPKCENSLLQKLTTTEHLMFIPDILWYITKYLSVDTVTIRFLCKQTYRILAEAPPRALHIRSMPLLKNDFESEDDFQVRVLIESYK